MGHLQRAVASFLASGAFLGLFATEIAKAQNGRPLWPGDVELTTGSGVNGADQWNTPPNVAMVPDGAAGMIVIWTTGDPFTPPGVLYAQRLDASGKPLWIIGGIPIAPDGLLQTNPRAISDGAGGAIVAWTEPEHVSGPSVLAQRIDGNGNALWMAGGVVLTAAGSQSGIGISPDGFGGALLAWQGNGTTGVQFFAQRLDANGNAIWGPGGVQVTNFPVLSAPGGNEPLIVTDGNGGAVISFEGPATLSISNANPQVLQHIDSSGNLLIANGITITGISGSARMVSDSTGGAIIVGDCYLVNNNVGLCAQRLDASGNPLWGQPVVVVSNLSETPELAPDGNGGVFITWEDWRDWPQPGAKLTQVYLQHLDTSGRPWAQDGVYVSVAAPRGLNFEPLPRVVSDQSGGALVTWQDCWHYTSNDSCFLSMDMYARRFDPAGNSLWTTVETNPGRTTGVIVSAAARNQGLPFISPSRPMYAMISDTAHGALLAWPDGRNDACDPINGCDLCERECDVYSQRISDQFPLDFSLTPSITKQSLAGGQSTQYALTLATTNGPLAGDVSLSCSGLPTGSSCAFSPASFAAGTSSAITNLTISTTTSVPCLSAVLQSGRSDGLWYSAAALLLGTLLLPSSKPRIRKRLLRAALCSTALLSACGGGGSQATKCVPVLGTPSGTYTITVNATQTIPNIQGSTTRTATLTLVVQ